MHRKKQPERDEREDSEREETATKRKPVLEDTEHTERRSIQQSFAPWTKEFNGESLKMRRGETVRYLRKKGMPTATETLETK